MTATRDLMRAREYLLGGTSEQDIDAIEQAYFRSPEALEDVEAAEEQLIEEYLSNQLSPGERTRFEQHYLSSAPHRTRVETVGRLMMLAASASATANARGRTWSSGPILALAAALVLMIGAAMWFAIGGKHVASTTPPVAPSTSESIRPRTVYAWTVTPVAVRGTADTRALVVPAGTDDVRFEFEGESGAAPIARGYIVIRTVTGDEVWQGPINTSVTLPPGAIAEASVPAVRLRPDDYTVALVEIPSSGADTERARYFLPVRAR